MDDPYSDCRVPSACENGALVGGEQLLCTLEWRHPVAALDRVNRSDGIVQPQSIQ